MHDPFISTGKASRPVDTDQLSALGTDPSLFFMFDEMANPGFTDDFKIIDHTHAIPGSVSLIQLFQPCTGITGTAVRTIRIFFLLDIVAVSDFTRRAVF